MNEQLIYIYMEMKRRVNIPEQSMVFPSKPTEDAILQQRGTRCTLTHPPILPNTLTEKMASENNSQDERTALVESDPAQDANLQLQSCKQTESKMTLYHWTQSFNSQKVSPWFSTTERRTAPLMMPVDLIAGFTG